MTKQFGPSKDFPPLTEPSSKPMFKYNLPASEGSFMFIELEDTPSSYNGSALCVPIVNTGENRLDFISFSHSSLSDTHNLTDDIDHNQLLNYEPSEHIRWDLTGAEQIHINRLDLDGLASPDDDFYVNLTLIGSVADEDQLLIADASDSFNYKRITKATLLSDLGTIQNAYYRIVSDKGIGNMDADNEDFIYIQGDGEIIETFGENDGANKLSLVFKDQLNNLFFAGPASGLPDTPTFRSLVNADMPSGYNSSSWDIAYNHSQEIGNPHGTSFDDFNPITYNNDIPMPVDVGGAEAGTIFTDQTLDEMFTTILYPYMYPSFISFSIQGESSVLEVGDSIAADRTFLWDTDEDSDDNIEENSISITNVTGAELIEENMANDGSQTVTYGAVTKTTATTNVFRIDGENTKAEIFSRNLTFYWRWRIFYGESVDAGPLSESEIESLRISELDTTYEGTYEYLTGGYKYLVYPESWGEVTSFKDESTMLSIPFESPYSLTITNTFGVSASYWIYRSTNILNASINIIIE